MYQRLVSSIPMVEFQNYYIIKGCIISKGRLESSTCFCTHNPIDFIHFLFLSYRLITWMQDAIVGWVINICFNLTMFCNVSLSLRKLSGFRGVALTNCFSSIFHFGQISKFKKGLIPRKKMNQTSCGYAHLHNMSFITSKFHEFM